MEALHVDPRQITLVGRRTDSKSEPVFNKLARKCLVLLALLLVLGLVQPVGQSVSACASQSVSQSVADSNLVSESSYVNTISM